MIIKDLVKDNSAYGSIACIKGEESVVSIRGYLAYNFDFIKEFDTIILAVNWLDGVTDETVDRYLEQWYMAFPNSYIYTTRISKNLGHTLSTMELDNQLFSKCKQLHIKWLFKSTEDVIINSAFLDRKISKSDFYYFNGIGKGGMEKYNFDYNYIIDADFYPNTNFYIINTWAADWLYDEEQIYEVDNYIKGIENYNGRIWEWVPGFSSEGKLAELIENRNIESAHLLNTREYILLLTFVDRYNIHDNSFKNIMCGDVCHFHFPNQPVTIIE